MFSFARKKTGGNDAGALFAAQQRRDAARRIAAALQRSTDALTRKDLAAWRAAWQRAINVESPDRRALYDIYRDVEADLHLTGCVEQRIGMVMARSFKLSDRQGNEQAEAAELFNAPWFKRLLRYCMEARFWGHSLIELGDVTKGAQGQMTYSDVRLIPRKHVVPEFGRVVTNAGDDWHSGIDYRAEPYAQNLIEAGAPDDLGLYLKAAGQTIPKKNMLSFWDTFGEIFGMPARIARTASRDPQEISRLDNMLKQQGALLSAVMPPDTELQFIETARGDAYNVYDKRIERANSELSKLILGQTMTVEDGSSLSQSQTHMAVLKNIIEADCDNIRDIVNNMLIPKMIGHGFPLSGIVFDWDYSIDYTPEQQIKYEKMIADRYEVDPQYFAEKYSMPVGERRNAQALPAAGAGGSGAEAAKNARGGFFD